MPHNDRHEALVLALLEPSAFLSYKASEDRFRAGFLPRFFGGALVFLGNAFYGREPSYGKFKAIEVIARIPYQSWEVASYMLLTFFYSDEKRAVRLSQTSRFGRESQDNETMHVVVLSRLARKYHEDSLFLHTLVPLAFSFFYFLAAFALYLFSPRASFELNYVFEQHALEQYSRFLEARGEELKRRALDSPFLRYYGRRCETEYDLFRSICCDETIHRNLSAQKAREYAL